MPQKTLTVLQNPKTGTTYYTRRNKKGDKADKKLELKKFDKKTGKYETFVEVKGSRPRKKKEEKPQAQKSNKKDSK